jgi:xanthine dehydrogenase accessory factor
MLVLIKGAGDLASGVALRLVHAGFGVVMTELAAPTCVRRTVSFCRAVPEGRALVEDVEAVLVGPSLAEVMRVAESGRVAVMVVEPDGSVAGVASHTLLKPDAIVDGIMAKQNTGTRITDAALVVALGPGFTAGVDCHAVVETARGHTLGRVLWQGSALANTGVPGNIGGYTTERLLRSPCAGVFSPTAEIGDRVRPGDVVATVEGQPVIAQIDGVLRGLLPEGLVVTAGMKAGDVDPRAEKSHCFTVSDKALSVAGGVLEAVSGARWKLG